MTTIETPVLIVGGGAGLKASMLLSKLGIESLLVSALPSTSILPKAHVLNQRAMKMLTVFGVANEIYARGTPAENMRDSDWASASPCRQANLPQIQLEPIRKRGAEVLAPGPVRFHHELVDLEQDAAGVTTTVLTALDATGHAAIDPTNAAALFP